LEKEKKGHPQKIPQLLKKAIPIPKKAAIFIRCFPFFPVRRRFPPEKSSPKRRETLFFSLFVFSRLIFYIFMV
jgi:hypothetical protein